jgi:HD-GYP domain-containing protein (c-di-GMP phosphodiesterase class II)
MSFQSNNQIPVDKKLADLQALLEISKAMSAERDLDTLLEMIISQTTRVMDADRSSLFLVDMETNELWSRIAQGAGMTEIRFPVGVGIAGYVAKTGKTLNIKEAYDDTRFNKDVDKKTGYRTKTILCMPLINHEDKIVGVIQVINKNNGIFTEYDEELLQAFCSNAAVAVENAELYKEKDSLFKSMIETLAATIDARDPVTAGHSQRVALYALNIARNMGFNENEIKVLHVAATLHDVGKIGIPDKVLLKPGRLTKDEYQKIQRHVVFTKEILDQIHFARDLKLVPYVASCHHERVDGKGYPNQLKNSNISISAKILAVVDVFDALTAYDRPYKSAMPLKKALSILEEGKGTQFDPEIVDIFIKNHLYNIERREFTRIGMNIDMEYSVISEEMIETENQEMDLKDKTIDISGTGLRFKTKQFIPKGKLLKMSINLDSGPIELIGKIIRIKKDILMENYDVSIEFFTLTQKMKERIQHILIDLTDEDFDDHDEDDDYTKLSDDVKN